DRPVYRPGDTIHFMGNFRQRDGSDYRQFVDELVTVRVRDAKNNTIFDQAMTTDEFGAVGADLALGDEPPLGNYRVEYSYRDRRVSSHSFSVEEYKKPEFEVLVDGPEEEFRLGGKVEAVVRGEYYFGGSVGDAKVNYRVFRVPFYPTFNLSEPYAWLYGSRESRSPHRSSSRELVAQGEGVTDSEGRLSVEIDTAAWAAKYPEEDHAFEIEADMTDASRRTISGAGRVLAPRRALFAHVEPEKGFYRVGETTDFEIRVQKPDGTPKESSGTVQVFRIRSRLEGQEVIEQRDQIQATEASTDAKGMGRFRWQADSPGRFAIRYVTMDRFGEPVIAERAIWITQDGYRAGEVQVKNVEIITDASEYKPGDTAYIMLNSQFDDANLLVTVEADREILSWQTLRLTGRTGVLALPILEKHAPNVFVHVLTVHGGRAYEANAELFVPPTHRFLDVDLKFEQPEYQPGAPARITLRAMGSDGTPVSSQFGLSIYDRSITYIRPDGTPDIRKFFYGDRRSFKGHGSWDSNTSHSLSFMFQGYQAAQPAWTNYRNHGLPAGWYFNLEPAEGQWGADGLAMAPEEESEDLRAEGSVLRERKMAGSDGFTSADAEVAARPMAARAESRRGRVALNDYASPYPSPSLESSNEDNGDVAMVAPELRENFADSAYWSHLVRTNAEGVATIEFRLPDSLTTWLATAHGLSRETLVGTATTTVKTRKRIMARLQAPRFFTERDEIVISGLVRNEYENALEARVELALEGGTLTSMEPLTREVKLAAGEERRFDWRVRVIDSGTARIQLTALTAQESDAMRLEFPVFAYGIDKVVTRTAVLDGPEDRSEILVDLPTDRRAGSSELEITLSPSIASSLLESLPYLIEYPYGCVEQTLSRFLPAVVVAKTLSESGITLAEIRERRQDLLNRDQLGLLAPVYSDSELARVTEAGLRRLASMQNSDGGFGWWRADRSALHMSCYVAYGLVEAQKAKVAGVEGMLSRVLDYIAKELPETRALEMRAYATFVMAQGGRDVSKYLDDVFARRDGLMVQSKAQ
ncbi:MAG: hypothetical protein KDB53_17245, partial [Planctomycetes bacterium]|nr:hypothetical protein [Planctomycetota bacterium]